MQLLEPVDDAYSPGRQATHTSEEIAPAVFPSIPLGQGVHSKAPALAAYLPTSQRRQSLELPSEVWPMSQGTQEKNVGSVSFR